MPMCVNVCVGRTHDNKTVKHPCLLRNIFLLLLRGGDGGDGGRCCETYHVYMYI